MPIKDRSHVWKEISSTEFIYVSTILHLIADRISQYYIPKRLNTLNMDADNQTKKRSVQATF